MIRSTVAISQGVFVKRSEKKTAPEPLKPGLYIVGTPIGNLGDITLRALETLRAVDVVMAEDTRHSLKLLNHFEIKKRLVSCHKFNEAARLEKLRSLIQKDCQSVALITDSGMPCVSDPGFRSVAACHECGIPIYVVPGPSAVTSAAALSGLIRKGFFFEGFLSAKGSARRRRLEELRDIDVPLILFESPYRLVKLIEDIAAVLGERELYIGRELTKHFEESIRGKSSEVLRIIGDRTVKGECVLVIDAAN